MTLSVFEDCASYKLIFFICGPVHSYSDSELEPSLAVD
jgi:hypothetical protein